MITQSPLLSALPTAVLDMTTDFTPLFIGLVLMVCFSVLGLTLVICLYDSRWSRSRARDSVSYPKPLPELPNAVQ